MTPVTQPGSGIEAGDAPDAQFRTLRLVRHASSPR